MLNDQSLNQETESRLQIAKIVGASSETNWSQVHAFTPTEKEKREQFGSLVAVFCLQAKQEGLEISSFGSEVIQRLHESYYGQEAEPLENLKKALEKVKTEFSERVNLQVIAAVVIDGAKPILYLAGFQAAAKLYRPPHCLTLLQAETVKTVSGYLNHQDQVILGTPAFFEALAEGVLRSALEKENLAATQEDLAAFTGARADNSQMAAAVINLTFTQEVPQKVVVEKKEAALPASNLWQKWQNFRPKLAFKPPKFSFFLKREGDFKTKKRLQLFLAVVLIILLFASIGFGFRKRLTAGQLKKESQTLVTLEEKYKQALNLVSVSPGRSRELLEEAKADLEALEKQGSLTQTAAELKKQIEEAYQQTIKEAREEAKVFLELKLVKDGFNGENWGLVEKEVFILDPQLNTILSIDLESKAGRIVLGKESLKEMLWVAANENGILAAGQEKLAAVSAEGKLLGEQEIKDLGTIKDIYGFSANAYLLGQEQIYKFVGSKSGLSDPSGYLTKPNPALNEAVSLAIDGSVWVLTQKGEIFKFTRGVPDNFVLKGLDKPMIEPVSLFTSKDCENLYVLDRKNTRVVVVDKKGDYQLSYFWTGIAGASDLVVSEALKKIFLLTGGRIYEIGLR